MRPEEVVDFAEALARITASGGGPKALAAHLASTAGGGVLLEDAHWRHLAAVGSHAVPASARDVVESGAPGRALQVNAGNLHVGWLSIYGNNSQADAGLLLRMTAAAIGVELGRDAATLRGTKAAFWETLLSGGFLDAGSARNEAAVHGIASAPQYLVVILAAEAVEGAAEAGAAAELRAIAADAFRSGDADLGFLERDGSLFVFAPAARSVDVSNVKTAASLLPRTAARRAPPMRVSGGVGTAETLAAMRASASAAHAALAIGRRLYGSGRVVAYEELGAYPLLYEGADVPRLRAFASETLAPLRAYDEKHQTELERTLKLYFSGGQNIKTAAAELNVHRHTIFYRLRQIGEITSRALESPHDQLTFRLAIAIDGLHE